MKNLKTLFQLVLKHILFENGIQFWIPILNNIQKYNTLGLQASKMSS